MDIPVYHNYTIYSAWKTTKMHLGSNNKPKPSWLEARSRCLKRMCKCFYIAKVEILEGEKAPPEEAEDTPLEPPACRPDISPVSLNDVGVGRPVFPSSKAKICVMTNNSIPNSFHIMTAERQFPTTNGFGPPPLGLLRSAVDDKDLASAKFSPCLLTEGDIVETEIILRSPTSISSDDTCVNTPDQVVSPLPLEVPEPNIEEKKQYDTKIGMELPPSLMSHVTSSDPDTAALPSCCETVQKGWENTFKFTEDCRQIEVAGMKDDFEADKKALQADKITLQGEKNELQSHLDKARRELREKGTDYRLLKRDVNSKSKALMVAEDREKAQADAIQQLKKELTSQKEELKRSHEEAMKERDDKLDKEMEEFREALHRKAQDLNKEVDAVKEWRGKAFNLQAQHDNICRGGVTCTQQISLLNSKVGKAEQWLRQCWPQHQFDLKDTKEQLAVKTKALEDAREEITKAKLRLSNSQSKREVAVEELKHANTLLLADDNKAVSVRLLQEKDDQIAVLMTQNHDRIVENSDLHRKVDNILQTHLNAVDLNYTYVEEFGVLHRQYVGLQQANTACEITKNQFEVLKNTLQIENGNLKAANSTLQRDIQRLALRNKYFENPGLQLQSPSLVDPSASTPKSKSQTAAFASKQIFSQDLMPETSRERVEAFGAKPSLLTESTGNPSNSKQTTGRSKFTKYFPTEAHANNAKSLLPFSPKYHEAPLPHGTSGMNSSPSSLSSGSNIADNSDAQATVPTPSLLFSGSEIASTPEVKAAASTSTTNLDANTTSQHPQESNINEDSTGAKVPTTTVHVEETQKSGPLKAKKPHTTKKESTTTVFAFQAGPSEVAATSTTTTARVMSKKEQRAMKKRR